MRRAKLEDRILVAPPLDFNRTAIVRHRGHGMSLTDIARVHRMSRATVGRAIKEAHRVAQAEKVRSRPPIHEENRRIRQFGGQKEGHLIYHRFA